MKKCLKIIGIILGIIIVIAAVVVIWKWDMVKAAYMAMRYDTHTIDEKLASSQEELQKTIESQTDIVFREMTEEEKNDIDSGKKTKAEVAGKIFNEGIEEYLKKHGQHDADSNTTVESDNQSTVGNAENKAKDSGSDISRKNNTSTNEKSDTAKKENASQNNGQKAEENTKQTDAGNKKETQTGAEQSTQTSKGTSGGSEYDAIVAKYVSQLSSIQGKYMGQIGSLAGQAEAEFHSLPQSEWTVSNRSAIISKYIGIASGLEGACDGEVSGVLAGLQSELSAIGADTSIVSSLRDAYNSQKSMYASSYMGQLK